jgi:hypothetical protein
MCYLYVYICLWMYWITNIMISMYMYLSMLYPINDLIWLYATTAYHVYWNVSDNRVICHICIPYYILNIFRLSCFSTIRIYPFIYSNLSDNHVICIAVFCSKYLPLCMAGVTNWPSQEWTFRFVCSPSPFWGQFMLAKCRHVAWCTHKIIILRLNDALTYLSQC